MYGHFALKSCSLIIRVFTSFALVLLSLVDSVYASSQNTTIPPLIFGQKDSFSGTIVLTEKGSSAEMFGLEASLNASDVFSQKRNILVRCNNHHSRRGWPANFKNATKHCDSYSIYSDGPVNISVPYDKELLQEEIDESAVRAFQVFQSEEYAQLDSLRPIESYLDNENKKTLFTLRETTGKFVVGAIKEIDATSAPPKLHSGESLTSLSDRNPLEGIPMVSPPEHNQDGSLSLSYPLDFLGARPSLKPSISINYSSNSGYGNLGEGWQLSVPEITIETRWGVPHYSDKFETETYLFNGAQLIPESGDSYTNNPDDSLQLIPMPHRTTSLRPRKRDKARFVLRRDEKLWRFIRHGDNVDEYWWEAWAEMPDGGKPKIMYFGRAPGRIPGFMTTGINPPGRLNFETKLYETDNATLRSSIQKRNIATKWALAREVDAHGNLVDYFWTHRPHNSSSTAPISNKAYDLFLHRIQYNSSLPLEETILRCREQPNQDSCNGKFGVYEVGFDWEKEKFEYERRNSRAGITTVRDSVISRVRFWGKQQYFENGQHQADILYGNPKNKWGCSGVFQEYRFEYIPEFPEIGNGIGRSFLDRITKFIGEDSISPFDSNGDNSCPNFSTSQLHPEGKTTRFSYDLYSSGNMTPSWQTHERTLQIPDETLSGLKVASPANAVRALVSGDEDGLFSGSPLGMTNASQLSGSLYLGLNVAPTKSNSFGMKVNNIKRTSYTEGTMVLDVNGDGLQDLISRNNGKYYATLGMINDDGKPGYETSRVLINVPDGFVGFNREPFASTRSRAVEVHPLGVGFVGSEKSSSKSIQDVYVHDVNSDGRIDVVSAGRIFINNSIGRTLRFSEIQDAPFVDASAGFKVTAETLRSSYKVASDALSADNRILAKEEIKELPEENDPRVDMVRYWRAPYSGDIIVRGKITYNPRGEIPSELRGVPSEPDKTLNEIRFADRRDGLLFSVELSQNQDGAETGIVKRCFFESITPQNSEKFPPVTGPHLVEKALTTPSTKVVEEKGLNTDCLVRDRINLPELGDLENLPTQAKPESGLLLSVNAGDVVYFRAHSIYNAQDDVLKFSPTIDYLRLVEGEKISPFVSHGLTLPIGKSIVSALLDLTSQTGSTLCSAIEINSGHPSTGTQIISEEALGICEPDGRSAVRYSLSNEWDEFTNGSGIHVVPYDGRLYFSGKLRKPGTPLAGEVFAVIATTNGKNSKDNPDFPVAEDFNCSPALSRHADGQPKNSDYFSRHTLIEFGREANNELEIEPIPLKVFRGDQICVYTHFFAPSEEATVNSLSYPDIIWPFDFSQFQWVGDGLRMNYDRIVLSVAAPEILSDDVLNRRLSEFDQSRPIEDMGDCSYAEGAVSNSTQWHKRLKLTSFVDLYKNKIEPQLYFRCAKSEEIYWVTPLALGHTGKYFDAKQFQNFRLQQVIQKGDFITLPKSELSCGPNNEHRLHRFSLKTSTIRDASPGTELVPIDDISLSEETKHWKPIANRKTIIQLFDPESNSKTPLEIRKFTLRDSDETKVLNAGDLTRENMEHGSYSLLLEEPAYVFEEKFISALEKPIVGEPYAWTSAFSVVSTDSNLTNQAYALSDKVGFEICAPDQSTIIIESVISRSEEVFGEITKETKKVTPKLFNGIFKNIDKCDANLQTCPITGSWFVAGTNRNSVEISYTGNSRSHVERLLPIEQYSMRGWGDIAVTTGYKENKDPKNLTAERSPVYFSPTYSNEKSAKELIFEEENLDKNLIPTFFNPEIQLPKILPIQNLFERFQDTVGSISNGKSVKDITSKAKGKSLCKTLTNITQDDDNENLDMSACQREGFLSKVRVHSISKSERTAGKSNQTLSPFSVDIETVSDGDVLNERLIENPDIVDLKSIETDSTAFVQELSKTEWNFRQTNTLEAYRRFNSNSPKLLPVDSGYCSIDAVQRPLPSSEEKSRINEKITQEVADLSRSIKANPFVCGVGPDHGLWVTGTHMSAGRIGKKDLRDQEKIYLLKRRKQAGEPQLDSDSTEGDLPSNDAGPNPNGLVVALLPKITTTSSRGFSAGAGASFSETTTNTNSITDVMDFNGDGFPDQIVSNRIFLTDPFGRYRCGTGRPWADIKHVGEQRPCLPDSLDVGSDAFSRDSDSTAQSLSISTMTPKTFAQIASAAAGRPGGSRGGRAAAQTSQQRDPTWSMSFGLSFGGGKTFRTADYLDLTGDGLVDRVFSCADNEILLQKDGLVSCSKNDDLQDNITPEDICNGVGVAENTGYGFGEKKCSSYYIEENSQKFGLSGSIGFGTANQEFGGGFSADTGVSRQDAIMSDFNGDGLADQVYWDGGQIKARLNTGRGISAHSVLVGTSMHKNYRSLSHGETDTATASGYFTVTPCIPIPPICFIINPGLFTGATVNRQAVSFADYNADGFPDIAAGSGVAVANELKLDFDNNSVDVNVNPFVKHGKLSKVFLPTNPASKISTGQANYKINYALSKPSWNDPNSRLVFSEVEIWDGITVDDLEPNSKVEISSDTKIDAQLRRTCHAYSDGFYDRFERSFLGFSKVSSLQGCQQSLPGLSSVEALKNGNGVRRIDRHYSNRSIYDNGLLLREITTDLITPVIALDDGVSHPTKVLENTYTIVDVGLSTDRQFLCFNPAVDVSKNTGMLPMLESGTNGLGIISYPRKHLDQIGQGACDPVPNQFNRQQVEDAEYWRPSIDRKSRRLAPVLVQTVQTVTESNNNSLKTALQYEIDHYGRVRRTCDLGTLDDKNDDLCTNLNYADDVQLVYIHGATGGGTLAYDLQNLVNHIEVVAANDNSELLRRRSASYSGEYGDLLAVCAFVDVRATVDPCADSTHIEPKFDSLDTYRRNRIAVSIYEYDQAGNLSRYASPVTGDGYLAIKQYGYDQIARHIQTAARTAFCKSGHPANDNSLCPIGSGETEGIYESKSDYIDWRHAVPRLDCDINGNGLFTRFDGYGRPLEVRASWAGNEGSGLGPMQISKCNSESTKPDQWSKLIDFEYRVGKAISPGADSSLVRARKYVGARDYKMANQAVGNISSGLLELLTDTHHDHLGRMVNKVSPIDRCIPGDELAVSGVCQPSDAANPLATAKFVTSPLIKRDLLDREVEIQLPQPRTDPAPDLNNATALTGDTSAKTSKIVYDGFDRPLHVRLSDQNTYAFRYLVEKDSNSVLRHRAISRDARCVLNSIDRDVRGNITAVNEYFHRDTDDGYGNHLVGSSDFSSDIQKMIDAGWVKSVADNNGNQIADLWAKTYDVNDPKYREFARGHQQIFTCAQGEFQSDGGQQKLVLLENPEASANGAIRSRTSYEYDSLNQLKHVNLPKETASADGVGSGLSISVDYDNLGRRVLIADPDRGVEKVSYDLLSNAICRRTSALPKTEAKLEQLLATLAIEQNRQIGDGARKSVAEDQCLKPKDPEGNAIERTTRYDYLFDQIAKVSFEYPRPIDGDRKNAVYSYGKVTDANRQSNLIGRLIEVQDASGTMSTSIYHSLGMAVKSDRTISELARENDSQSPQIAALAKTLNVFDNWGSIRISRITGSAKPLTDKAFILSDETKLLSFDQTTRYRYSRTGQIAEVLAGSSCRQNTDLQSDWVSGTADCSDEEKPLIIVEDTAFDERGLPRRILYGNGVATRNTFDFISNRLVHSTSYVGIPCAEQDLVECDGPYPGIRFQNIDYRYDAAGQVVGYRNDPRYSDCTYYSGQRECHNPVKEHAIAAGLLVSGSHNRFSYDEIGRLKFADKEIGSFGDATKDVAFLPEEAANENLHYIHFEEDFRFTDSHLLTGIKREMQVGAAAGAGTPYPRFSDYGKKFKTEIEHSYEKGRPYAVDLTRVKKPTSLGNENIDHFHDHAGRVERTKCSGCIPANAGGRGTYNLNEYQWDPDDTLVSVNRRVDPSEIGESRSRRKFFIQTNQIYDHQGNRVVKQAGSFQQQGNRLVSEGPRIDTLYLDNHLTISRAEDKKPEGLFHIHSGPMRVASKWTDEEGLFTYHAQLATRTVSDVVYSNGNDVASARIHRQMEYAPFGELLIGRASLLAETSPENRELLQNPLFRFNSKESDQETALTYFGARHFDQRLALWLSPDPILGEYLNGETNFGIYAPRNLSSYGFGWGNPIMYSDEDGNAVNFLVGGALAGLQGGTIQGIEIAIGLRDEFSLGELAIDVGLGATTSGLSTIKNTGKLGRLLEKINKLNSPLILNAKRASKTKKAKNAASSIARRNLSKKEKREVEDTYRVGDSDIPCVYCGTETTKEYGKPNSLEFDHIDAFVKGGKTNTDNSVTSCRTCNRQKGTKGPLEHMDRIHIDISE